MEHYVSLFRRAGGAGCFYSFGRFVFRSSLRSFYSVSKASIVISAVRGTGNGRFSGMCVLVSNGYLGSSYLGHQCCMKVAHTGGHLSVRAGNDGFGRVGGGCLSVRRERCAVPRRVILRLNRGSIGLNFFGGLGRRVLTLEDKSSLCCGGSLLCSSRDGGPVTGLSRGVRSALTR